MLPLKKIHRRKPMDCAEVLLKIMIVFSVLLTLFAFRLSTKSGLTTALPLIKNMYIYIDDNGTIAHGLQKIDGDHYYFSKKTGFMQRGFQTIRHSTYYFGSDGRAVRGLKTIGSDTYYFDQDGKMVKSRFVEYKQGGRPRLSYFNKKGHRVTGDQVIDSKLYHFDQEGNYLVDVHTMKEQVSKIIKEYPGTTSVYFKDLQSNQSFSINNQNMYPCCMIKTVALAAVFSEIDKGTIRYEDYQKWIEPMIIQSDNTCYNYLMKVIGDGNGLKGLKKANQICQKIGMKDTELHHGLVPGQEFFTDGGDNTSNAKDIGLFFEKLYDGQIVSKKSTKQMLDLFKQCGDDTALQLGLPSNTAFAHKTGCADPYYHDGGIVYLSGRPYILVVFSEGSMNHRGIMSEISQCIYQQQEANPK